PALDVVRADRNGRRGEDPAVARGLDVDGSVVSTRHVRVAAAEGHVLRRGPRGQSAEDVSATDVVDGERTAVSGRHPDLSLAWHETHVVHEKRWADTPKQPRLRGTCHIDDRDLARFRTERDPERPAGLVDRDVAGPPAEVQASDDDAVHDVDDGHVASARVRHEGVTPVPRA